MCICQLGCWSISSFCVMCKSVVHKTLIIADSVVKQLLLVHWQPLGAQQQQRHSFETAFSCAYYHQDGGSGCSVQKVGILRERMGTSGTRGPVGRWWTGIGEDFSTDILTIIFPLIHPSGSAWIYTCKTAGAELVQTHWRLCRQISLISHLTYLSHLSYILTYLWAQS